MKRGGEEVTQAVRKAIAEKNADSLIHTTRTRCNGRCEDACVVIAYPQGIWYRGVTPEACPDIIAQLLYEEEARSPQVSYTYSTEGFVPSEEAVTGVKK
ncbi:Uncharacterized protein BN1090_A2_00874 [Aneurinibacillus migulanus]|nr:Uncharacterized protein BN1090_A2_00874 [Aneurinibacillus migulanus]